MNQSKRLILEMLKDGRIDEDEAMALLDALEDTKEKKYSSFEEEIKAVLNNLAKTSQDLALKLKDYLDSLDYEEIKNKFSSGIDAAIKAIKDIRINF